jgi:hypothetical protein
MSFSESIKEILGEHHEEEVSFFYDKYNYKRLKI